LIEVKVDIIVIDVLQSITKVTLAKETT